MNGYLVDVGIKRLFREIEVIFFMVIVESLGWFIGILKGENFFIFSI